MPTLREGSLLYMPTALPGMSIPEAQRLIQVQDKILKSFPEVERVFGKAGRADTSTDTAPVSMVETTILLKPRSDWPRIERWYSKLPEFLHAPFRVFWPDTPSDEELITRMNEKLTFPGMPNIWTMPIRNRIDMLSTGIRSTIGVKVFGPDLKKIEEIGKEIETALKPLRGARTVVAERAASGYFVDVDFDRQALAAQGLSLKEAQDTAMAAIGGENVSVSLSGRERYPIQVRMARSSRSDLDAIRGLLITTPAGAQIPLSTIAKVKINEGPGMIRDENAMLVGYVFVDVDLDKRDVGSFVDEAKNIVESQVKIPTGYSIAWSGQFENMQRVKERLKFVIPITLLLIALLLHFNTG